MAADIVPLARAPHSRAQVTEIFWETSSRTEFASPGEKASFQGRYLDVYLDHYPHHAWVALLDGEVLGYIVGAPDTLGAADVRAANPHLAVFEDMFARYPAHLHINLTARARGQGVGGLLMQALEAQLRQERVPGLHLITSPTARNVSFYLKNGFTHRVERLWEGRPLLMLGKSWGT